jgi:hypothetical protein
MNDMEKALSKLVSKIAGHSRERTFTDDDGEEITVAAEDPDTIKQTLLDLTELYFSASEKEKAGGKRATRRKRKLADFGETEERVKAMLDEIGIAATSIKTLNACLPIKIYRAFTEAGPEAGEKGKTQDRQVNADDLPGYLEQYVKDIDQLLSNGKSDRLRNQRRKKIKRLLISWAGDAHYELLSDFLEQYAESKGIELSKTERSAISNEALRKFASATPDTVFAHLFK